MRVGVLARSCAVLAAVLSPSYAMADGQSAPREPVSLKDLPEAPPPLLWAGAYVGVHMGRAWDDSSVVDFGPPVTDGGFACAPAVVPYCGQVFDYGADGWVSGIQLGYNWQRDRLVFGVEADLGRVDAENSRIRDRTVDEDLAAVDYGWYGTLTARLGVTAGPVLLYAKGGAAFAEIKNLATDLDEAGFTGSNRWFYDPLSTVRDHGTETGWALGGGVEYALGAGFSVKAEYMFMDFGSRILTDIDGDSYKLRNELHSVKLGINYQLGADDVAGTAIDFDAETIDPAALWTGPYLGVHAGYARAQSSTVDFETIPGTPGSDGGFACDPAGYCGTPFDYDGTGWMGGMQAGYNWQRGRLIFGIEGDLGRIDLNDEECKDRTETDSDFAGMRYSWYGAMTGRVGLPFRRAMVYVKGGVVLADITNHAGDIDKVPDTEIFYVDQLSVTRSKHVSAGWTLGGGLEYALHGDWRLKAEYMYMDFGSEISSDIDGDLYQHENELHVVKLGLNYYVHRPEPELPPMK